MATWRVSCTHFRIGQTKLTRKQNKKVRKGHKAHLCSYLKMSPLCKISWKFQSRTEGGVVRCLHLFFKDTKKGTKIIYFFQLALTNVRKKTNFPTCFENSTMARWWTCCKKCRQAEKSSGGEHPPLTGGCVKASRARVPSSFPAFKRVQWSCAHTGRTPKTVPSPSEPSEPSAGHLQRRNTDGNYSPGL